MHGTQEILGRKEMRLKIEEIPGVSGWGGINWQIGIDIYTLLYIRQITNKDLLNNTGNAVGEFPCNVLHEKKYLKKNKDICACITDLLDSIPETKTTL